MGVEEVGPNPSAAKYTHGTDETPRPEEERGCPKGGLSIPETVCENALSQGVIPFLV